MMQERKAKIETADPELAATYELMQAMKRFWSETGNISEKQRAVLHMALKYMPSAVQHQDNGVWLRLK